MITSNFPLRKFLDTLLPGFILQIGIWYIYRPYLINYFPNITFGDSPNQTFSSELKLVIFLISAISLGILINHMSDIAVELNYYDVSNRVSRANRLKRIAKSVFWLFTFHRSKDVRIETVKRYLKSNRKSEFLKMAENWAWTKEDNLKVEKEMIIVHQHICSRLRVISKETELLYESFFAEVAFVCSLFTSFLLLFILSVISIPLNFYIVLDKGKHLTIGVVIPLVVVMYILTVVTNYSIRRRFKHFCSQVITIGLHIYNQEKI